MPSLDPAFATVAELSAAFQRRALSPVDVVDALLARIDKLNPRLHAVITLSPTALKDAQAADKARRNGDRRPLLGIPIAVKNLYDTFDMPTTNGSMTFAGFRPARDA